MTSTERDYWIAHALVLRPMEDWYGGVYARPISVAPFDTYYGGNHGYDHPTIVPEGVYLLRVKNPDGSIRERSFRVPRYALGIVNIKHGVEHDVINLTENRLNFLCVSLQEDMSGEIREQVFHDELVPNG